MPNIRDLQKIKISVQIPTTDLTDPIFIEKIKVVHSEIADMLFRVCHEDRLGYSAKFFFSFSNTLYQAHPKGFYSGYQFDKTIDIEQYMRQECTDLCNLTNLPYVILYINDNRYVIFK